MSKSKYSSYNCTTNKKEDEILIKLQKNFELIILKDPRKNKIKIGMTVPKSLS